MPMSDSQLEILYQCLESIEDDSFWDDVSCQSELLTESFIERFCHKLNRKYVMGNIDLSKEFIESIRGGSELDNWYVLK